jgi:hypothetical protein
MFTPAEKEATIVRTQPLIEAARSDVSLYLQPGLFRGQL